MKTQTINISLPRELVKKIDEQAKKDYATRSDYIRTALLNRVRLEEKSGLHPELVEIAKQIMSDHDSDLKNLAKR